MTTKQVLFIFSLTFVLLIPADLLEARGRGGGGGRGGGMSRAGGMSGPSLSGARPSYGGARPSAGGARPSYGGSVNRSPSFSRPTQPVRSGSYGSGSPNRSSGRPSSPGRTPGSVNYPGASSRIGDRQIGSVSRTPGSSLGDRQASSLDRTASRVGDRQLGAIDRTSGQRVGDRQIGAVDRTPGGRVGDRQLGAADRTPANRAGDRQLGGVDRTPGDMGRAAIPGLAAAGGAAAGSRLSGDMRSQLEARRGQVQQNRESGAFRDRAQGRFENREEMVASRREQLQNRMESRPDRIEDRQQYRDDMRQDRQDYRDSAREDWQNWADNNPWNDHWNHDHWHDNFKDYWDYMWDEYPVWSAFRVTAWGINRASYLFGSGGYYNPYPVEPYYAGGTVIDYSQPLVTYAPMEEYVPNEDYESAMSADASAVSEIPDDVVASFDQARAEFKKGNYDQALGYLDQALSKMPKDATLHEVRGLTLFALARYREAAAAVHAVLAVGPGMNWTTMSDFYADQTEYIKQLRALENHVRQNPNEADARFLFAYHCITLGHNDAAKEQLQAVLTLQPKDTVAADLLTMLGGEVPESAATPPITPLPSKGTEADLIGSWKATRGAEQFELTLEKDGQFKWTYSAGSNKQAINGVFIVEDGVLAMEPDSGGVMLADVSKPTDGKFTFRQNGTADEPLEFQMQK